MATYAIGDVQGCFDELQALLARVGFNRAHDRLWFVGDLVNRGPKSLEVLRFVRELGDRAVTVLGNHDLHLITQHEGFERKRKDDTFTDVLGAPDAGELVDWVRSRPLMHVEYDPGAAEDSWRRMVVFFARHLRGVPPVGVAAPKE